MTHQNAPKIHIGLIKLAVYVMLKQHGVVCDERILSVIGDLSTPLSKVLSYAHRYMSVSCRQTWYYLLIPSYGAKHLLSVGDEAEKEESEVDPLYDDESGPYYSDSSIGDYNDDEQQPEHGNGGLSAVDAVGVEPVDNDQVPDLDEAT
jgi:hypothetical protein